ncbi:MAG TPA: endonuclease III domain-containing protein [Verrucomicrobiae bacterium]|jgi:endonuclease-3 related protein|nr:endonuclease III domain-containing protein [Verrucomicrobiae bacterium]
MAQITRSHREVLHYYRALLSRWGRQNWWPAQSRFEVIVGAYLTQNTAWTNVEKAIASLRREHVLSVQRVRGIPLRTLEKLVRSSGYFRQKARNLKTFIRFLDNSYGGSLDRMFAQPTDKLRTELLALKGVGPETADSILLYAGNHPVFVVDAYTRRIFERHEIIGSKAKYDEIRLLVEHATNRAEAGSLTVLQPGSEPRHPVSRMSRMSRSMLAQHYNEFHALIVRAGNQHCRKAPKCEECPLREYLPPGKAF